MRPALIPIILIVLGVFSSTATAQSRAVPTRSFRSVTTLRPSINPQLRPGTLTLSERAELPFQQAQAQSQLRAQQLSTLAQTAGLTPGERFELIQASQQASLMAQFYGAQATGIRSLSTPQIQQLEQNQFVNNSLNAATASSRYPYFPMTSPYLPASSYAGAVPASYGGYGYGGYGGYGYGGYGGMPTSYGDYGATALATSYDLGSSGTTSGTRMKTAEPATVYVDIYDNYFEPAHLTVSAGTTVKWTNRGEHRHTVTSDNQLWDSGILLPGDSYSYTFKTPGTFSYHCMAYPREMRAEVVVRP